MGLIDVVVQSVKGTYKKIVGNSLYKNSIFLLFSSAVLAIFGFAFWLICARLFSPNDVGLATTVISVVNLITTFALLGLNVGLIRFLPSSTTKNEKISTVFTLCALVTIGLSVIFLVFLEKLSPSLDFIRENLILAAGFVFFMAVSSFSAIIEDVFIAYRSSQHVLLKNSISGIVKVGLPFAVVSLGAYGIFGSYMVSLLAGSLTVFLVLIIKFDYKPKFTLYYHVIEKIGRYSFGNYVAGFIGSLALLLLPLIITNKIGPITTAYYFIALQIANLLLVIPSSITSSLFAEGSHDGDGIEEKAKSSLKVIAILLIPAILIIVFLGKFILLAFGKDYSLQGFMFLRIMAVSAIFVSINSVFGSVFRVKNRIREIGVVNAIGAALTIGLSLFFINNNYSLIGIGVAFIAGQIAMNITYWWLSGERRNGKNGNGNGFWKKKEEVKKDELKKEEEKINGKNLEQKVEGKEEKGIVEEKKNGKKKYEVKKAVVKKK